MMKDNLSDNRNSPEFWRKNGSKDTSAMKTFINDNQLAR